MIALALCLAFVQAPAAGGASPHGPERIFEITRKLGSRIFVDANRAGATAWSALKELEDLGAFQLNLEVPELRKTLESESMNLSLSNRDALTVAELIAVAAGLDLVTTPIRERDGRVRWIATVASPPSAKTEKGRQQLRRWAVRWYRNLLTSELRANRETADAETRVHIDMALLLIEQGNLSGAAEELRLFRRLAPKHPYVPHALLHEARCMYDMGRFATAIDRAREVLADYRDSELAAKAAVLMGRSYLALVDRERRAGRKRRALVLLDEMVHRLELFAGGFADRREYAEVLVLIGLGHLQRRRPDQALTKAVQAENTSDPFLMPDRLWADYTYLRGSAEIEAGDPRLGERLLWQFLRKRGGDPRCGSAWLRVAKAEIVAGDPLQALFAARKALRQSTGLRDAERFGALVLEAQALLQIGMVDRALDGLEARVNEYGPARVPELALHLATVLIDEGRPERAKRILGALLGLSGASGERARLLLVEAERVQGNDERVVELIRRYARDIHDSEIQARLSELLGDAYTRLGREDLAAYAYNGRIL